MYPQGIWFFSVFNVKKGHWVFMDRRNGINSFIFVKNKKRVILALFPDSDVVLWDNSQRETCGGLIFQCIDLSYLIFVLSAFLWPWKTGRQIQVMVYYQVNIVCHFNFVLQRVYACKIPSYFIQLRRKANSLCSWKLLLSVG